MPILLKLDIASEILLTAPPWVFGFAGIVFVPHFVIALFAIGAELMIWVQPRYGSATMFST